MNFKTIEIAWRGDTTNLDSMEWRWKIVADPSQWHFLMEQPLCYNWKYYMYIYFADILIELNTGIIKWFEIRKYFA